MNKPIIAPMTLDGQTTLDGQIKLRTFKVLTTYETEKGNSTWNHENYVMALDAMSAFEYFLEDLRKTEKYQYFFPSILVDLEITEML